MLHVNAGHGYPGYDCGHGETCPLFFRKTGTEWIYRLIKQPRRIKRHIAIWIFIFRVIKIWVKKKFKF
ncbi:MAG: WecB/TagA/CpsF family glycosyltransferase [candidate division WOR-3 bacterium]